MLILFLPCISIDCIIILVNFQVLFVRNDFRELFVLFYCTYFVDLLFYNRLCNSCVNYERFTSSAIPVMSASEQPPVSASISGQAIPVPRSLSGDRSDLSKYNCDFSEQLRESIQAKNVALRTRSEIYGKIMDLLNMETEMAEMMTPRFDQIVEEWKNNRSMKKALDDFKAEFRPKLDKLKSAMEQQEQMTQTEEIDQQMTDDGVNEPESMEYQTRIVNIE